MLKASYSGAVHAICLVVERCLVTGVINAVYITFYQLRMGERKEKDILQNFYYLPFSISWNRSFC